LSEDRKSEGLLLKLPIKHNISIANLAAVSNKCVVNLKAEDDQTETAGKKVNVITSSINKLVGELSGGNQQKVAIAKWLFTDCDIFIFDEPTRGIDVGARAEIYKLMNALVDQGKSIILVSSDMNEILTMSNRIITMYDGKIAGIHDNEACLTQQKIMKQMLGGTNDAED
jgi:ribose transport system ATP-binding protein